ncbi:MAG: anaerobic ribonucleoside-triphosphate reductase [Candidatus Nealsonbacteria bacterium]
MASVKTAEKTNYKCHDCKTPIHIKGEVIENGVLLDYDLGTEKVRVFKCKACYDKNPSLANYQKCEVYSRIVGYLRPISQWNDGKKEEFMERKEYVIPKES